VAPRRTLLVFEVRTSGLAVVRMLVPADRIGESISLGKHAGVSDPQNERGRRRQCQG
jgi:hypothetical protein